MTMLGCLAARYLRAADDLLDLGDVVPTFRCTLGEIFE
jgi:hypothetical protein